MPKTSRSEQFDFAGLEIIADEFTGTFNGSVSGALSGVALVTTPDGSDAATTQTLANALKVKINEIINALN